MATDMDDVVKEFFDRKYEEKINKNLLYYSFPHDEVEEYVKAIIAEPLPRFLVYIEGLKNKELIRPKDVFQFSNLDDATLNYCLKLKKVDNPGLSLLEIGKLLQDDGKERKDGAYVKYGENHAKLAKELGLGFELCNTYYLSGIGYIFAELSEDNRKHMISRLILRSKLICRLYQASENGDVDLRQFLYMLADSTYIRRRSNIKKMADYLIKCEDNEYLMERLNHIKY